MKKAIVVALMCLNAVLVVALIAGARTEKAYGQVLGANYLVVTGNIQANYDAVYVIDLASRKLAAWRYEKDKKPAGVVSITPGGGRELRRDFGRAARK